MLLALAVILSLAGCGKHPAASNGETGERKVLTIGLGTSASVTDYEDNYFTLYMEPSFV